MIMLKPYASGVAVFINSTITSYHWGCYGTSAVIQHRLETAGYLVHSFPVDVTHAALPNVSVGPIDFDRYGRDLKTKNLTLYLALHDADMVVINGEGTLHRSHAGPINLLALIAYSKSLGKPVHLINHSCYPNGDRRPAQKQVEDYYRSCLRDVDTIAPREPWSGETYKRLGIDFTQAFDSLPIYIRDFVKVAPYSGKVLLSAASNWTEADAKKASSIVRMACGDMPVGFLSGGYKRPPQEDKKHYAAMSKSSIDFVDPKSIEEWVNVIASAPLMITGRFHHYVAALCVGTPVILMPGNTPKSSAVADWLGHPITSINDPNLCQMIKKSLEKTERASHLELLATRAEENYSFLSK